MRAFGLTSLECNFLGLRTGLIGKGIVTEKGYFAKEIVRFDK